MFDVISTTGGRRNLRYTSSIQQRPIEETYLRFLGFASK